MITRIAKYLAFVSTLLILQRVNAQTNVFPATGNVGIGTTAPNEALEVAGNGRVFIGNGGGSARKGLLIDAVSGGTYVRLHPYNYGASASIDLVISPFGGGNVGIGTTSPQAKLDVNGAAVLEYSTGGPMGGGSLLSFSTGGANVTAIQENWGLNIGGSTAQPVKIPFSSLLVGYTSGGTNYGTGNLLVSGNVGIGTTTPTYPLSVNGTIEAKEVIVQTGWSDYVFSPTYHLEPLSQVEQQIRQKGHLPGMPSAEQVAAHGISIGDMQAKLLAKIEELTLHQIEQEKEIRQQDERIARLEEENQQLRKTNRP